MKSVRLAVIFSMAVMLGVAMVRAADDKQVKPLKETFEQLLPGMGAEKGFEGPQQQWQELCFKVGAPGNEAQRAEVCKLMAEKLVPATPARARIWLLKQLERNGREECVEAVAKMLDDQDPLVRDAAVAALANNPAPTATAILGAKLRSTTDNKLKVALAGALQFRADWTATCQALAGQPLSDSDPAVAAGVARAFGRVNSPQTVLRFLADGRLKTQGEVRFRISDACLQCADRALKQGMVREAAAIYKELNSPPEPRSIRMAALKGMLNTAGDRATTMILDVLAGDDTDPWTVALGHLAELKSGEVKSLAEGLAKLPPAGQVALLNALGWRRDKAALPGVLAATKSTDEKVRSAALRALGGVGDASVVPLLVEAIFKGGDPGSAARESLETMFADGADAKLVEIMKQTTDLPRRAQLIEILDRRRAEAAVPALLKETRHENADIRRRAMAALGRLASERDVQDMVFAMFGLKDPGERDEAEKAITAVCNRIPDEDRRAEPVLELHQRLASWQSTTALLPVLGRIGGAKSLEAVRIALGSRDAGRYDAAVRALCNWPDMTVADDLLKLAASAKTEEQRIRTLRAFTRVISVRDEWFNDPKVTLEKLALLKRAMPLAGRDEDRGLILQRAAAVRHVETLRFVAPYLDKPELAQQACRTVVELAHHRELRDPNKAEFDKALDKVIQICKDRNLVDRAKGYKAGR
jgi:HEAT repeat protein